MPALPTGCRLRLIYHQTDRLSITISRYSIKNGSGESHRRLGRLSGRASTRTVHRTVLSVQAPRSRRSIPRCIIHEKRMVETFMFLPSFFHGVAGNRTPVQRPIHYGISHHRQSINIPYVIRRLPGL